jgi:2-keto-3-deoxy-L-rhamnonate aldolase RhmA
MLELLLITNDPVRARRCDALPGMRLWIDLERNGKAQRQAGRNTFISTHQMDDIARVRDVLTRSRLMVRVNPLHEGTAEEVDAAIDRGAQLLMLPMFRSSQELACFASIVAGRVPLVPLLETPQALASISDWIDTPGLFEVYVGLNDLHLAMGLRFMFEPLAAGLVDQVARVVLAHSLRFGFGGIARLDEGLLPGRDVLAEHLRMGSSAVILSRTFQNGADALEAEVKALREAEALLALRAPEEEQADQDRIASLIRRIALGMKLPGTPAP